jgi:peptidase M28-like protein
MRFRELRIAGWPVGLGKRWAACLAAPGCGLRICCAVAWVLLGACEPAAPPEGAPGQSPAAETPKSKAWWRPAATPEPPPVPEIWKQFSGEKAFAHVRKLVELGPRPAGSGAIEEARKYIEQALKQCGWQVTRQAFSDQTPRGKTDFVNLIARYAGGAKEAPADTQQAIVASHFDTKLFSTIKFVGANDGGSSTGALIELARVLALDPAFARRVELVFFDGEEAVSQFTETDGLYGSRHYAQTLRASKRYKQLKLGVLLDMIGDKNLSITLSPDSPSGLTPGVFAAADALGVRKHFTFLTRSISDDHKPLNEAGVPTIDLIDFRFDYWHTADDTLDKLSPDSLHEIGAVTLYFLRQSIK